ncbi:hypothetical protein NQ176_g5908 [Zarea fungicola]|uniref:Uncharacterized protein n=1 Tax=Zarea fungicola TaxID=93591 RepID=A0ACC1N653_9HYPO|nr:hypothetical protein NQ176_g5908 [Lecanicillium fungicola]
MEYDKRQVADHKVADDAWMAIHGKVYNITQYLADHPGGAEVLVEAAGTDATEAFDNAGHSEDAFDIMETYLIGALQGYKAKPTRKAITITPPPQTSKQPTTKTQSVASKVANLGLFSLAVTAVYYGSRYYGPSTPKWLLSILNNETPGRHGYGFTKGLLVGAGIFTVVDALLAQHFARMALNTNAASSTLLPIPLSR